MKHLKRVLIASIAFAASIGLVACTPPSPGSDRPDGWAVRICKTNNKTQASKVKLYIGLGGNSASHHYWKTWVSNENEWVPLPNEYKHVGEIWIRAEAVPRDRNVHMGTFYNGECTQKMTFDNGEEHETSQGDSDDFDCPR